MTLRSLQGSPTLLLLQGSDEAQEVGPLGQMRDKGSTDAYKLLGNLVPRDRLRITPNFLKKGTRPPLPQYHTIFNLITDPDQNPRVLDVADRLLRGFHGRVINPPAAVRQSSREKIAQALAGTPGLLVPQVLRLRRQPAELAAKAVIRSGLDFPLLVREAGTHTGRFTGLAYGPEELEPALGGATDHLVTEFVDFRSTDGLYRKYRVWCVGNRIVFRHMVGSDGWNVHVDVRKGFMGQRPDLIAEERALFEAGELPGPVTQVLSAVQQRVALDMFGVDFSILPDGRLLLFEANACMNFIAFSPDGPFTYTQASIAPMQRALWELVGFKPPPGTLSVPEETAAPVPNP